MELALGMGDSKRLVRVELIGVNFASGPVASHKLETQTVRLQGVRIACVSTAQGVSGLWMYER